MSRTPVLLQWTHNMHKMHALVGPALAMGIEVITIKDLPNDEPFDVVEDEATFVGNARKKAREAARRYGPTLQKMFPRRPIIVGADDSGLIVPSMAGTDGMEHWPWVHSKRWFPNVPDWLRAETLMHMVPFNDRAAYLVTALALVTVEGNQLHITEHRCPGGIPRQQSDKIGWGYASVFIPDGATRTRSEMNDAEWQQFCQRRAAAQEQADWISNAYQHLFDEQPRLSG